MRRVSSAELRAFLIDRLGLSRPFANGREASAHLAELGMIQIDSIRSTGLRNHELAWVARAEAPPTAFYEAVYGRGEFRESHYPLFAVRRDWLPRLIAAFADFNARHRAERRRLQPLMRRLTRHMRDNGPVTVAQFTAKRIPGGFNTIKATTAALEYLFYDRAVQIAGRTRHFHRIFDLTERAAPELVGWTPLPIAAYERFLVDSALDVLKIATADQLADRVAIHFGKWRGESIRRWRTLVDRLLPEMARAVIVTDLPNEPLYWYRAQDEFAWDRSPQNDGVVRLVPPLDNLMFSRKRFSALFGFDYKFEAYTPADQRRFYYAMPILHGADIVGLIDARLDRHNGEPVWQISALELARPVPPEALRTGIHRIARLAGAGRRALVGRCAEKAVSVLARP